jgi:hypothetical protein
MTENAQPRKGMTVTLSVVIALVGAASSWGVQGHRVSSLEKKVDVMEAEHRELYKLVAEVNTKLAVIQQQNAELLRRTGRTEEKVDKLEERER